MALVCFLVATPRAYRGVGLEVLPCDAIADGVRVDEAVFEDEGFEVAVEVCIALRIMLFNVDFFIVGNFLGE